MSNSVPLSSAASHALCACGQVGETYRSGVPPFAPGFTRVAKEDTLCDKLLCVALFVGVPFVARFALGGSLLEDGARRVATRLEPWISASVKDAEPAPFGPPVLLSPAARSGARRVDTKLELCTRGSSTMPSCAPSARTAGRTCARARDASLTRASRESESGSVRDGPRGRERRPRDHAAGRGDGGSEDAPAAAEETRAGERAREREGGHGVAHRVRWAVAPEEALPRSRRR